MQIRIAHSQSTKHVRYGRAQTKINRVTLPNSNHSIEIICDQQIRAEVVDRGTGLFTLNMKEREAIEVMNGERTNEMVMI